MVAKSLGEDDLKSVVKTLIARSLKKQFSVPSKLNAEWPRSNRGHTKRALRIGLCQSSCRGGAEFDERRWILVLRTEQLHTMNMYVINAQGNVFCDLSLNTEVSLFRVRGFSQEAKLVPHRYRKIGRAQPPHNGDEDAVFDKAAAVWYRGVPIREQREQRVALLQI